MAYNSSEQATTGYSPFYLMFGMEAVDLLYLPPTDTPTVAPHLKYVAETQIALRNAYQLVREKVSCKHLRQKDLYSRWVHGQLISQETWSGSSIQLYPRERVRNSTVPGQVLIELSNNSLKSRIGLSMSLNHRPKHVHFDQLKYCPHTICLPVPETSVHSPLVDDTILTKVSPPGTHMELLDPSEPSVPCNDSSTQPARYPTRTHVPPIWYGHYITH